MMSDTSQGPGWWLASDGKWYAPELAAQPAAPPAPPIATDVDDYEEVDSDAEVDDDEAEAAKDGSLKKSKLKKVMIQKVVYLGGLPADKGGYSGNMIVTDECIGMGSLNPKKSPVRWDEMAGISFDSATMKKSRKGKAVAFGVFALAAKSTQNGAEVTIQRKDGNVALYTVTGKTGVQVRAKIQPFMVEHGVPCLDDTPIASETAPAPLSTADEIAKLADLHAAGALTGEEFAAAKARLLS
jgi:Short C-terminal domain